MTDMQNLHIHSTYGDGKDRPEEMIIEAINRGFDSIGFSEHSYMYFSSYPYQMTVEDMQVYKKEIWSLKEKYKNIIKIFCGMEYEMYSEVPTDGFDYLIGSVHYLKFNDKILGFDGRLNTTVAYINDNFDGDGLKFAKKYYETVSTLPDHGNFDIIGHFDLCAKNNEKGCFFDESSKEYIGYGIEAIHALKGKIPLFEVNTGAISRGYRTKPYPQSEFLSEFQKCGFGAIITSDCHDKHHIDCCFEEARQMLIEAGFTTRFVLTDNGFKEVNI